MTDGIRRVGGIGLGRMGLPMARHLLHAGSEVAGFDLDSARGALLTEAGGVAAASAREVGAHGQAVPGMAKSFGLDAWGPIEDPADIRRRWSALCATY